MKTSESINEIAAAMAKAQGDLHSAAKSSDNPFFKSKYADLAEVWDTIRQPFTKHGLSIIQPVSSAEGHLTISTRVMHQSGQWIESDPLIFPITQKVQDLGSCCTYLRRYSLAAMLGVTQEDDDGNAQAATASTKAEQPKSAKPKAPPKDNSEDRYQKAVTMALSATTTETLDNLTQATDMVEKSKELTAEQCSKIREAIASQRNMLARQKEAMEGMPV
jgi:hypothetical protein